MAAADDPSTQVLRAYPAVFLVRTAGPATADRAGAVPQEARPGSMGAMTVQARAQGAAVAADGMQGRVLDGRSNSPLALAVGPASAVLAFGNAATREDEEVMSTGDTATPASALSASESLSEEPVACDIEQVSVTLEAYVVEDLSQAEQGDNFGQERLEHDVEELLRRHVNKQDCREFLLTLPLFAAPGDLKALVTELDQAVRMPTADQVNSTAALQVRACLTKSMVYPLLVLMHATAASQGMPVVFFVDVLHAVINSVFNKNYHVKMGWWASKSRHWWAGTANMGEGKSLGMKDVLSANMLHLVGYPSDFHFQQSGTSPSTSSQAATGF